VVEKAKTRLAAVSTASVKSCCMNLHVCVYIFHSYIYTRSHTWIHINTGTHTHTCACTHTQTHTHKHTHVCIERKREREREREKDRERESEREKDSERERARARTRAHAIERKREREREQGRTRASNVYPRQPRSPSRVPICCLCAFVVPPLIYSYAHASVVHKKKKWGEWRGGRDGHVGKAWVVCHHDVSKLILISVQHLMIYNHIRGCVGTCTYICIRACV